MMIAGQKIEIDSRVWSLKQSFSGLVDAMRFSQRLEQLKEEVVSLELEREKKILALEKLIQDISSKIQDSRESLGKDYTFELSKQIPPFSKAAAENVRKKIEDYYKKALKETKAWIESEKTRTYKSIESFLSSSPIPVLEAVIRQKFSDGAYSSSCSYRCPNDIKCEFSLNSKHSSVFGQEFTISSLGYEVKLPISLGKSWLKKRPTPEYEKLDQYVLTESEATEGHLIVHFSHPEREAKVRVVYSKQEGNPPLLEINYKDSARNIDIMLEPGLHRFLKTESVVKAMDRIWLAATELEKNKIALTALLCNGEDVLEQLDAKDFIEAAWATFSPIVTKALKISPPENSDLIPQTDGFDELYVREKVSLLGEGGQTVLMMLGL